MKDLGAERPAVVRPAEDVAGLLALAKREHLAGQESERQGLEHYRRAGEALLKAKGGVGHGSWEKHLKATSISSQRASEYMRLADGWLKSPPGGDLSLKGALAQMCPPEEEGDEEHDEPRENEDRRESGEDERAAADVAELLRNTIAALPPAAQAEVVRSAEREVLRDAAARAAREPDDARVKRIDRADDKVRLAIRLLEGLGGDEGEEAIQYLRDAREVLERLRGEGA